jgi:hypothetical protein
VQDGDIINIDVTVYLDGYHGDTSRTFLVGNVSAEAAALVAATKESLDRAIAVCKPGASFQEIGKAIHDYADEQKLGVVRSFVGHGVGKLFHAGPAVLHYRNSERYPAMQVEPPAPRLDKARTNKPVASVVSCRYLLSLRSYHAALSVWSCAPSLHVRCSMSVLAPCGVQRWRGDASRIASGV